jgi:hypothetical protein
VDQSGGFLTGGGAVSFSEVARTIAERATVATLATPVSRRSCTPNARGSRLWDRRRRRSPGHVRAARDIAAGIMKKTPKKKLTLNPMTIKQLTGVAAGVIHCTDTSTTQKTRGDTCATCGPQQSCAACG